MRVGQMAGVDDLQEVTDEERKNRRQLDTELGDFLQWDTTIVKQLGYL